MTCFGQTGPSSGIYYVLRKLLHCVGFEVLTVVVMKSSIFWDITPYSAYHLPSPWFFACHIFPPLRLRRCFLPTRRLTFSGLHGVITQEVELFVTLWSSII
jgi:hypothetical protein